MKKWFLIFILLFSLKSIASYEDSHYIPEDTDYVWEEPAKNPQETASYPGELVEYFDLTRYGSLEVEVIEQENYSP